MTPAPEYDEAGSELAGIGTGETEWLDLDALADVSIIIEGRRVDRGLGRWSADRPGEQMIEIRFHEPISMTRVKVVSSETERSRTQEMTLWVSSHRGERHREVLRQQFNFTPHGATNNVEEYAVQLEDVSVIHLRIVPSIDGQPAIARVTELRVASAQP